jgi:Flp pilus assembly pilin Flp
MTFRRFPAPWHADPMPGGYVFRDANWRVGVLSIGPPRDHVRVFQGLANNDFGSTSIEYGLIAAGVAIGITMAASSLGSHVKSTISNLADMASSSSKVGSDAVGASGLSQSNRVKGWEQKRPSDRHGRKGDGPGRQVVD